MGFEAAKVPLKERNERLAELVRTASMFLRSQGDRQQPLRVSDAVRRQIVFDARTAGVVG